MPGRPLRPDSAFAHGPYAGSKFQRRREVLRETLARLDAHEPELRAAARANHARWAAARIEPQPTGLVEVHPGDWGDVTLAASQRFGERFAVLNMANAYTPGGAYVEGTTAQEENLFRRTDCHYRVDDAELAPDRDRYTPAMTALLSAAGGRVYLDTARPRLCLRGAEDRDAADLGYRWLRDDEVFELFELRAAAVDLRGFARFDPDEARRRIRAQFDTLREAGVRHAVLSAFGCGAFQNPADQVAAIYADALREVRGDFAVVLFAVFHPGYGPDNYTPFRAALAPLAVGVNPSPPDPSSAR